MEWLSVSTLNLVKSSLFFSAIPLVILSGVGLFYLKHSKKFGEEYPSLSEGEFHWLIWPAIGANYFFEKLFGKRAARFTLTAHSLEKLRHVNLPNDETVIALFRRRIAAKLGGVKLKPNFTPVHKPIIDFLMTLSFDDSSARHALAINAGLDEQLQKKLRFELPSAQFFPALIDESSKYGNLQDGRNPLVAILNTAKESTGQENRKEAERLIRNIEAIDRGDAELHERVEERIDLAALLADLQGREYVNEAAFVSAIEAKLGQELTARYVNVIRAHAEQRTRLKDLFTWRSVGATLSVSVMANLICVVMILLNIPPDLHEYDPQFRAVPFDSFNLMQILVLSYFVFLTFNFFGDLLSITVTRNVVSKIVAGRCNFLHYLVVDMLGIVAGYVVTLLPPLVLTAYCWVSGDHLNKWIHTGLLGNALVPFFLFIFATSGASPFLTFFVFLSVFSITIPTAIYLSLMAVCYLGFRCYWLHKSFWRGKPLLAKLEYLAKFALRLGIVLFVIMAALEGVELFLK